MNYLLSQFCNKKKSINTPLTQQRVTNVLEGAEMVGADSSVCAY